MNAAPKKPQAEANRLSSMLNLVLGTDRFPVKVDEVAQECSSQLCPGAPISKVQGEDLEGFDGMLTANKARSKWLILYNSAVASEGRKRFTIAHEFGHYLLHRERQQHFECGGEDIETGDGRKSDIETDADQFASALLMPLDDFRQQVAGQPISFDLLEHCAARYGTSLTAAALRWTEIAAGRVIVIASRDDHMLWAKSNEAAFKSGAYFSTRKRTIAMPGSSLAHSDRGTLVSGQQTGAAQAWFPREQEEMPLLEMTKVSEQYEYALTLLVMPDAEWQRPRHDDGEPEQDTLERFLRNGQPLNR